MTYPTADRARALIERKYWGRFHDALAERLYHQPVGYEEDSCRGHGVTARFFAFGVNDDVVGDPDTLWAILMTFESSGYVSVNLYAPEAEAKAQWQSLRNILTT